jgi:hypothetical protein
LWLLRREVIAATGLKGRDKRMFSTFIRNWKTSSIGAGMAAVQLHQGGMNWGNAAVAAFMMALGMVAKDSDKTGL